MYVCIYVLYVHVYACTYMYCYGFGVHCKGGLLLTSSFGGQHYADKSVAHWVVKQLWALIDSTKPGRVRAFYKRVTLSVGWRGQLRSHTFRGTLSTYLFMYGRVKTVKHIQTKLGAN